MQFLSESKSYDICRQFIRVVFDVVVLFLTSVCRLSLSRCTAYMNSPVKRKRTHGVIFFVNNLTKTKIKHVKSDGIS